MRSLSSGGAASCSLSAQAVAVFAVHRNRLVTQGSIHKRVIFKYVGGRICDNAHKEGDQRGVIHDGKQEGRVDREHGDGAHGGNNGGGWGLHTFLTEFYSAGMADAADPQRVVGNSRKIRTGKQRTKTCWKAKNGYRESGESYSSLQISRPCASSHPCLSVLLGAPGGTVISPWVSWRALFSPEVDVCRGQRCSVWEALKTRFQCQGRAWQWGSWCFPWRKNWPPVQGRIPLISSLPRPASFPEDVTSTSEKAPHAPDSCWFTCAFSSGSWSNRKGYWEDIIMSTDTDFMLSG